MTGAFEIEPGVEALLGSSRFAYSDKPPGRAGTDVLFDDILRFMTWKSSVIVDIS